MKMIIGRKVGMTRIFKDDKVIPVTVIKAGPCYVVQKKTIDTDGYNAIQIGFEEAKKVNKPMEGVFKKAGVKPLKILKEFRVENPEEFELGQEIKVDIFAEGDKIDITGWSKGRGFAGAMKRWGFRGGPKSHGAKFHRELGSVGQHSEPARIFKGKKMPGQYGNERVTILNSEIVKIDVENNLIAVKGGVPGARGGLVLIRTAKRG
ncbi:50S ribosomal protein L3 [Thermosipho africanus H17ap60334]|jgi:large subunit ribosomal protein L3|uniref:Large ribosomal subunit protein uL3 n=2 Tax=Thermosipho TaxID=2420 RepID=RL3_THEAB|nr:MULTISPECIES: 50S ribosomal protein L3 [Thermosipho]B7IHU6.1 RecName: Full=Large ribosomal subunit protein uL3; AltName: Full=50S ribosomal protein L3 [Thermosipho africanus TCF52B]MDK2839127.1 large subunit ribosomal protein [Thermosipho sp. (in: thermotogales)]HCF38892.1 50S ribosomal protein L3 [Thermosipho africanus]ACJ75660.1 ribosomal protein L3 [Thermosipho africanus TCF52B]EKF49683.1 50S ribosomal protein L3 [Thermosipho africanus H17ap60334]MBB6062236.1 large subunit ribosomal pro